MGLFGILLGLVLLVWLAYRGWSILLLAPGAALIAAAFAGGPLLAFWTQTFMDSASRFIAQFFPLFLLGAIFGKLMEDSGSVTAIAEFMIGRLGPSRAVLTVVLAGALVTFGGVSLFVAVFVLAPMAQALFRTAQIPNRLIPATVALGTSTFTMSALPGTPAIQNAIPIPFFGTTATGRTRSGGYRLGNHGQLRIMVARPRSRRGSAQGRGLWPGTPRLVRPGGGRRDRAPARYHRT
jgi:H+/gluconate symporter-like permease